MLLLLLDIELILKKQQNLEYLTTAEQDYLDALNKKIESIEQ